ncbi:MAG: hypothetical protein AAGH78_04625 [Cyanobacteria bacterium P01_H01_bin.58]
METQQQRQAVAESSYRTGQGSTDAMLMVWQRTEDLEAQCEAHQIEGNQMIQALGLLTGDSLGKAVLEACVAIWHSPDQDASNLPLNE